MSDWFCSNCAMPMDDETGPRRPCPRCGSTLRTAKESIAMGARLGDRYVAEAVEFLDGSNGHSKIIPSLVMQGLIIPEDKVNEGILVKSTSTVWMEIAKILARGDWEQAAQLTPTQWEELIAGAYDRAGYQVILTPRSGDFGRDIIATTRGVGSVRILGSVKRYAPGHLVDAEACRSLLGVLSGDPKASKGIITTTSDFAPRVRTDPFIAPFLPTRLELMNGSELKKWLADLSEIKLKK
ncbi:restriction endonuclease [Bradyrhizobium sp. GCM10027634]|uniref:restriction endonuclease n=1 Tax=unclassified Bradyrhizobium TaxID=2631580 RepID=UPI00263B503A|nr:restriction endonuclease [Bradyrhizobium sp. WYCCWR 12677]MDN5003975.1 restriction endonuclease [Bradyrhizobium sp. WYCCWR 12677]